jgi:hypothetical protein
MGTGTEYYRGPRWYPAQLATLYPNMTTPTDELYIWDVIMTKINIETLKTQMRHQNSQIRTLYMRRKLRQLPIVTMKTHSWTLCETTWHQSQYVTFIQDFEQNAVICKYVFLALNIYVLFFILCKLKFFYEFSGARDMVDWICYWCLG